jgi:hypothetical protein
MSKPVPPSSQRDAPSARLSTATSELCTAGGQGYQDADDPFERKETESNAPDIRDLRVRS